MNSTGREKLAGFTKEKLKKHLTIKNLNDKGEYDLISNFTQQLLISKGRLVSCPSMKIFSITYQINRLVYIMFYGDIPDGAGVSFLNGDKKDYRVKNLIAGTISEIREIKSELKMEKTHINPDKKAKENFSEIFEENEVEYMEEKGTESHGKLTIMRVEPGKSKKRN